MEGWIGLRYIWTDSNRRWKIAIYMIWVSLEIHTHGEIITMMLSSIFERDSTEQWRQRNGAADFRSIG